MCQGLTAGWRFSRRTSVSSTNKTDRHDIAEILLNVALSTIALTLSKINMIKYILSYLNPTKRSFYMNKLFYHTISLLTTVKPALVTTSIKQ